MQDEHIQRIEAGRQVILDELKPSKAQIERGLALHAESFVADVQGSVPVTLPVDLAIDRLKADLDAIRKELAGRGLDVKRVNEGVLEEWRRRKAFETAFDAGSREMLGELYELVGVNLACTDVSGPDENSFDRAMAHLARDRFVYDHIDEAALVTSIQDVDRVQSGGVTGVIQHMAGVGAFAEAEDPIRNIDLFCALGVRMMQLTYIQSNKLCCSWMQGDEDEGLTDLGRAAIERMNELGIMVDVAHCGDRSAVEAMAASSDPVIISHTACRAVYDDGGDPRYCELVLQQPYARGVARPKRPGSRNASDELLRAIAASDGISAVYVIDYVLGQGPESKTFGMFARHLEHIIKVAGIDHVAIGADCTYIPCWEPSSMDWTNWPYWTVGLVCRGFSDDEVRKIIGGNYLRVVRRVFDKQPWGAFI